LWIGREHLPHFLKLVSLEEPLAERVFLKNQDVGLVQKLAALIGQGECPPQYRQLP
jgi:hypothetical protein